MRRTTGDLERRYALANASSGITRVAVVIYARDGDSDSVLAELRRFAAARDWVPVMELIERPDGESQWLDALTLVQSGDVAGIVTPTRPPCADANLNGWLAEQGAFLAEVSR